MVAETKRGAYRELVAHLRRPEAFGLQVQIVAGVPRAGLGRRPGRRDVQSVLHLQTEVERRGRNEEVVNQEVEPGVRAPWPSGAPCRVARSQLRPRVGVAVHAAAHEVPRAREDGGRVVSVSRLVFGEGGAPEAEVVGPGHRSRPGLADEAAEERDETRDVAPGNGDAFRVCED